MTNKIIPSVEREIGKRKPGDGAPFIKANLADVVASFDGDDEDAAFGGEVAGDLDEEPTVVIAIEVGVEDAKFQELLLLKLLPRCISLWSFS
jgi:hypothetical protein